MWKAFDDGSFSISSFFTAITRSAGRRSSVAGIWRLEAPPIVAVFGWLALQKRILTMDNLRLRGKVVVNGCPMCLCDEETVDHLLLNCQTDQTLWSYLIDSFGCSWVFPNCVVALF